MTAETLKALKLRALADVARFKEGVPLTKLGNVAEYYRTLANDEADEPIKMSNEELCGIVETVDGNDQMAQEKRVALILKAAGVNVEPEEPAEEPEEVSGDTNGEPEEPADDTDKEPERPVENANAVTAWAKSQIALVADDTDFNSAMATGIKADREAKVAPVNVLAKLRAAYGKKLDGFPMPGTKAGDKEAGNNPPDKRRTMTKKKGGGFRETYVSSIDAMWDATKEGRNIHTQIKLIGEADQPGKKNAWSSASVQDRAQAKQDFQSDITTGRRIFRQAIALHLHLIDAQSLPDVLVDYREVTIKEGDKVEKMPRQTRYPIVVKNKIGMGTIDEQVNYYSVTQFLGLDPSEARDPAILKEHNGSVWAALCASGGRGPGTPESSVPPIDGRDTFSDYLAEIAGWVEKRDNGKLLNRWLSDKDKDARMSLLMSIDTLVSELASYRDAHAAEIAAEHERLAKIDAAEQAAKNKAA